MNEICFPAIPPAEGVSRRRDRQIFIDKTPDEERNRPAQRLLGSCYRASALMVETIQLTAKQVEAVRREISRILNHPTFTTSERCSKLLRYITDRTLREPGTPLKERQIGHEVFGKPPDYDTSDHPIVRNAATETRKRLRQFYGVATPSEVVIELPQGSYLLHIIFRDFPIDIEQPSAEHVEPPVQPPRVDASRWRLVLQLSTFALALLCALWIGMVLGRRSERHVQTTNRIALSSFWSPVLSSDKELFVSVGRASAITAPDELTGSPAFQRFSMTDMRAYSSLAGVFESLGTPFQMRSDRETRLDELRDRPVILIGNLNNSWVPRLTGDLRYRYTRDGDRQVRGIEDSEHSGKNLWEIPIKGEAEGAFDFGIAERFRSPLTGDIIICVSGLGRLGTQAAAEFITKPQYLDTLPKELKNGNKSIQIVLRIPLVDGNAGTPEVVATHIW